MPLNMEYVTHGGFELVRDAWLFVSHLFASNEYRWLARTIFIVTVFFSAVGFLIRGNLRYANNWMWTALMIVLIWAAFFQPGFGSWHLSGRITVYDDVKNLNQAIDDLPPGGARRRHEPGPDRDGRPGRRSNYRALRGGHRGGGSRYEVLEGGCRRDAPRGACRHDRCQVFRLTRQVYRRLPGHRTHALSAIQGGDEAHGRPGGRLSARRQPGPLYHHLPRFFRKPHQHFRSGELPGRLAEDFGLQFEDRVVGRYQTFLQELRLRCRGGELLRLPSDHGEFRQDVRLRRGLDPHTGGLCPKHFLRGALQAVSDVAQFLPSFGGSPFFDQDAKRSHGDGHSGGGLDPAPQDRAGNGAHRVDAPHLPLRSRPSPSTPSRHSSGCGSSS